MYCQFSSVQFSCSVVLTLCDPMDCSTLGFPVHHQLPELAQTHVHWVGDAIQPSHPLLSPFPPAFNLSQHQGLFKWVSSSHQVAKVLEFQLQHQSFQLIFRTDFLCQVLNPSLRIWYLQLENNNYEFASLSMYHKKWQLVASGKTPGTICLRIYPNICQMVPPWALFLFKGNKIKAERMLVFLSVAYVKLEFMSWTTQVPFGKEHYLLQNRSWQNQKFSSCGVSYFHLYPPQHHRHAKALWSKSQERTLLLENRAQSMGW